MLLIHIHKKQSAEKNQNLDATTLAIVEVAKNIKNVTARKIAPPQYFEVKN
jgi:hypothetical protein